MGTQGESIQPAHLGGGQDLLPPAGGGAALLLPEAELQRGGCSAPGSPGWEGAAGLKEKLLVSACLLGENCKYNGGNNYSPDVERLRERFEIVPVCPEQLGGLSTPRVPSERVGERVLTRDGQDVTEAFRKGAERTLDIARTEGAVRAVLQVRSPSCGCGMIYDGTFSGTLVPGKGVAAELLEKNGVKVYDSTQTGGLLDEEGAL